MPLLLAFEDEGASDNGFGYVADLVKLFTWICVGVAIVMALALLLHWIGRRRVAERDAEDIW